MNATRKYDVPSEQLSLSGPVERPEVGHLPMRGDLAHIALAHRYLAAHYVVPQIRTLATQSPLRIAPREEADTIAKLDGGSVFEVLDIAGPWAWGCTGPEGPAGYLALSALAE